MLQILFRLALTTLVCSLAAAHGAQPADDPSDPASPAAAAERSSAFSNYRPYAEIVRPSWPALMQEVAPEGAAEPAQSESRESPAEPQHDHTHHR
jgi:hypothetical protein